MHLTGPPASLKTQELPDKSQQLGNGAGERSTRIPVTPAQGAPVVLSRNRRNVSLLGQMAGHTGGLRARTTPPRTHN